MTEVLMLMLGFPAACFLMWYFIGWSERRDMRKAIEEVNAMRAAEDRQKKRA